MPLEAMLIIEEQMAWLTPSAMAFKVRVAYPEVPAARVYNAWREHSQTYRRRDDLQLPSAKKFLTEFGNEVDAFEPVSVSGDASMGDEEDCWAINKESLRDWYGRNLCVCKSGCESQANVITDNRLEAPSVMYIV